MAVAHGFAFFVLPEVVDAKQGQDECLILLFRKYTWDL